MMDQNVNFKIAISSKTNTNGKYAFKPPFEYVGETNNFLDLCSQVQTPINLMCTFIENRIGAKFGDEEFNIYWPEDIMITNKASCFDISEFVREFCQQRNYDYNFIFVGLGSLNFKSQYYGHVAPVIKMINSKWYIFNYLGYESGFISGPFDTPDDAGEAMTGYFLTIFKSLANTSFWNNSQYCDIADYVIATPHDLSSIDIVKKKHIIPYPKQEHVFKTPPISIKMQELANRVQGKINKHEIANNNTIISDYPLPLPMFKNKNVLNYLKNNLLDIKAVIR